MAKLGVSERRACRVLGQHRSTQRKVPRGRADEAALTADIVALATRYGRYGYRRIAAMLRDAGWVVNAKRVERIWRREGLKVPRKQPEKGRLWLNDGSCIRLRPERPNHVWSYDFVEDRTHDGRKFRMLNVIDEFTRELRAIVRHWFEHNGACDPGRPEAQIDGCHRRPVGPLHSAACRVTSARTMAQSSSPRPCGSGSPRSAPGPPSSSPAAHGRTATARASLEASRRTPRRRNLLQPRRGAHRH